MKSSEGKNVLRYFIKIISYLGMLCHLHLEQKGVIKNGKCSHSKKSLSLLVGRETNGNITLKVMT